MNNHQEPNFETWINRLSAWVHSVLASGLSNLRLSLTLRIALHYAGQLLKTTLLAEVVLMLALCAAEVPNVRNAMEQLGSVRPQNGRTYASEQLIGLPLEEAWLVDEPMQSAQKLGLVFSRWREYEQPCVVLYRETVAGSMAAAYGVQELLDVMQIVFWTVVCIDLYRVLYFLRRRNGLNRVVVQPINDMAALAAAVSANNMSDRISVEGAKSELKDLAMVINSMLDRIEVSYNSQKQFVSDASHELRTPIAVIQGYVGMLQRWGKTDKDVLDEGISAIEQEAASMKELVERLLFLARHDKKTLMLEMESFDPLEVMSEVHREAKMLSAEHHFKLSPAQNSRINGDKDMIKQLMRILLDNAIKYTPAGGSITLGVKKDRNHCILSVTDTGAGISAEDLPKVFDRFYRCDEARKSQTSGHGLGLSIARIIVAAHGGKLKVRSKVGAGTTFSVWLPLENE